MDRELKIETPFFYQWSEQTQTKRNKHKNIKTKS